MLLGKDSTVKTSPEREQKLLELTDKLTRTMARALLETQAGK